MDIYILDHDQPTTCPKCGARTDFIEEEGNHPTLCDQRHTCLGCGYKFIGEFE
jgi:transposase-like protein